MRRLGVLRVQTVLALLLLTACTPSPKAAAPTLALPAGSLAAYVPQPGEVPAGMVFVAAQTGPADATRLVSFGADATRLTTDRFVDAYVVEYADPTKGTEIITTVARFADAAGATADLTADLATPGSGTTVVAAAVVGEQSGAVSQPLPGGAASAQLVSVRFRQGTFTFLVAVGAPGKVDPTSVVAIGNQLATRAGKKP